jgi:integrase
VRVAAGWDPAAGRYHQVSRTVRGTKRDAEKVLTQLQAQVDEGGATRRGDATVAELLVEWLDLIERDRSPSTMQSHRSKVELHLIPAVGRLKVRKLTTRHLDELYLDLTRKKHLAPATVRQVHAIIRRALHQAMRWGWIDRNPATLATLPAARRHQVRPPSPEAAMALIDQATPLLALFLRLSAATGARRGEVCALRWDDVDLGLRLVHIHRSVLQLPGKEVLIKDTKTHSDRTVSIDVETAARLATRRAEVETALEGGSTIVELPYIFSHDAGERPWRPDYVTAAWRRLCDAAGIVGVRVHDLRHMHASYLLDAGVPLHTVSRRLGHERASTTSDIYGHAIDARDQGAAELFGSMLNAGAPGRQQGS